jgi:hypothetical protein
MREKEIGERRKHLELKGREIETARKEERRDEISLNNQHKRSSGFLRRSIRSKTGQQKVSEGRAKRREMTLHDVVLHRYERLLKAFIVVFEKLLPEIKRLRNH